MLNPRLLIVGVLAVVCAWFPGRLAADELWRQLPDAYTLDLFSTLPGPDSATQDAEPQEPKLFGFRLGRISNGRVFREPVFLDKFGAGRVIPVQYQAAAVGTKDAGNTPCGLCCPLCQAPLPQSPDVATLEPQEPAEPELREGEPAKVLLQTMKQVRPSILDGTIFQEARPINAADSVPLEGDNAAAVTVRCIRNLEAQADHQRNPEGTACLSSSTAPSAVLADEAKPDAVAALRQAGRDLEATANMLEERGLYDQADHLRAVAQEMRVQARAVPASCPPPVSYAPTPMPGSDNDGYELAGDDNLDAREPKLQYHGECCDED